MIYVAWGERGWENETVIYTNNIDISCPPSWKKNHPDLNELIIRHLHTHIHAYTQPPTAVQPIGSIVSDVISDSCSLVRKEQLSVQSTAQNWEM